jgi:hypothetical protein
LNWNDTHSLDSLYYEKSNYQSDFLEKNWREYRVPHAGRWCTLGGEVLKYYNIAPFSGKSFLKLIVLMNYLDIL